MWIPQKLLDLLTINKETVDSLRTDIAKVSGENAILERELVAIRVNSDWMRLRVNQLEIERALLLEKAYPGLQVPTPEIARAANRLKDGFDLTSLFEDQSEDSLGPTN